MSQYFFDTELEIFLLKNKSKMEKKRLHSYRPTLFFDSQSVIKTVFILLAVCMPARP